MLSFVKYAGIFIQILSVLTILSRGILYGFSDPLEIIVRHYDKVVCALLGWMEPIINNFVASFKFDLPPLQPLWRHVFTLLILFLGALIYAAASDGLRRKDKNTTLGVCIALLLGIPTALFMSVFAGLQDKLTPVFLAATFLAIIFNAILLYGAGLFSALYWYRNVDLQFAPEMAPAKTMKDYLQENPLTKIARRIFAVLAGVAIVMFLDAGWSFFTR